MSLEVVLGGNWQWGSCPMGIIVLQGTCPRGNCPQGSFSRGSCPRGSCPRTDHGLENLLKSVGKLIFQCPCRNPSYGI